MLVKSKARLRFVSIPPRKMRLVGNMIKGMPVEKALNALNFTPKIAARHLAKTLKSAAANVLSLEGTDHLKPEDLYIKNVTVDEAPTQKRIRFQSMGRAFRYRKRFCHLTIEVEGQMEYIAPAKGKTKTKKAAEADEEKSEVKKTKAAPKKKTAAKRTTVKKSTAKKTAAKKKVAKTKKADDSQE